MGIELKTIDYVGEHERHGRVDDQGPFWFVGNFHFFTIAMGFVGPSMGLGFASTCLAGVAGIAFGSLFVAFHASQGAELGLPQMIQSRAQFGFRGVILVLLGTLFTFVGFNVVDGILAARGLHGILGWNTTLTLVGAAALAALLAIYGHDWLHRIFRWCFLLCLPLYTLLTLAILVGWIPAQHVAFAHFTWVAFFAQFAASASYNITYAPYVSDYSRYLPRATRPRRIIVAVFCGAASSAIWLIAVGAWLATRLGASDGLIALHGAGDALFHGFGVLMALSSVSALVATMGMNAYSAMLTVVTALNSAFELKPTARVRVGCILAVTGIWLLASLAITENAITLLFAALTGMLYLLVPWTAVNLVDYFFIRRGRYAITQLFRPHGLYGAWDLRGIGAYLLGFASTVPFFVLPDIYTGPAARWLGGVDVGWLVGLVSSAVLYALFMRGFDREREERAVEESDRVLHRAAP